MTQEREALPPEVVEAARKSLVISLPDALAALSAFDPAFVPILTGAVAEAETNLKLRAALNRLLFSSRNQTFAYSCKEELAKFKDVQNGN
jgi:hypothetical protein